jgi:hypothetical protein
VLDAALKRRSSTTTDGLPSLTGPYFSEERHTGDESVLTRSLKPGRLWSAYAAPSTSSGQALKGRSSTELRRFLQHPDQEMFQQSSILRCLNFRKDVKGSLQIRRYSFIVVIEIWN